MRKLLDVEGPVIGFLEKCGQLILLSVLWLLGCIPLVTIFASSAALYEAVTSCVRREQGTAAKTFWSSYRRNFPAGCLLTLLLLLGFVVPEGICVFLLNRAYPGGALGTLMVLNAFVCIYAPAVLARFRCSALRTWKLSCLLSLQSAQYTLLLFLGGLTVVALQIYVFPIGLCLILPGAWCWCSTFLLEKAMNRYTGDIQTVA